MLQAATFALQASAFASMSSSASGGSDPSSVVSSEQQQFSLPSFSNCYSFPNSPPCSTGDAETLALNPNNPDICVTTVIGDEVLLLGGGKGTPSSSSTLVSTESNMSSVSLSVASNERCLTSGDYATMLSSNSTDATSTLHPASISKSQEVEPMDMDEDS